jgi:hypothetical protein
MAFECLIRSVLWGQRSWPWRRLQMGLPDTVLPLIYTIIWATFPCTAFVSIRHQARPRSQTSWPCRHRRIDWVNWLTVCWWKRRWAIMNRGWHSRARSRCGGIICEQHSAGDKPQIARIL